MPPLTLLSLNALVSAAGRGRFSLKGGGFIIAEHARTLAEHARDFVDVALAFAARPISGAAAPARRRLLRFGAACERSCGASLPARRRHAGEEVGSGLDWQSGALARGDLVLGRPCWHHDERAGPRACERLSHGGGGRASGWPRRACQRWRRCYRSAAPEPLTRRALTLRSLVKHAGTAKAE